MSELGVEGSITFLYYKDTEKASHFYRDIMGFEMVLDTGITKVYKIAINTHVGVVDEERGWHRASPKKPVMLAVMVSDADAWYQHLTEKGVKTDREPRERAGRKTFHVWDPEGYVIEILEFYSPLY